MRKPDGTRWSVVPRLDDESAEEQPATVSVTLLGSADSGLYSIRTEPPIAEEHFEAFKEACRAAHAEWSWVTRVWRLAGQRGAALVNELRSQGFAVQLDLVRGQAELSVAHAVLSLFGLDSVTRATLDVLGGGYVVRVPDEYDLGVGYECPCDFVAALVLQTEGITLSPAAALRLQRLREASIAS